MQVWGDLHCQAHRPLKHQTSSQELGKETILRCDIHSAPAGCGSLATAHGPRGSECPCLRFLPGLGEGRGDGDGHLLFSPRLNTSYREAILECIQCIHYKDRLLCPSALPALSAETGKTCWRSSNRSGGGEGREMALKVKPVKAATHLPPQVRKS